MEFITSIKVEVPDSKVSDFVSGYESLEEYTWPEGAITSYLLQDATEKDKYDFKSFSFKSTNRTTEDKVKQFLILSTLYKKDNNVVDSKIFNERSLYLNQAINTSNYISTTFEFGDPQSKYSEIHDIASESAWE